MWEFDSYTSSPTIIPDRKMSSMRAGLEARYSERFIKYAGTTDDYIKKADQARQTTDSLRTAIGVVDTQKENIEELFTAAELMIKMIDDFQRQSGAKQIKNIPLAGNSIKSSPGKKLGYVKLAMKFVSAGMLHFMEMSIDMKHDLDSKDAVIQAIAEDSADVPILGRLTEVDFDELGNDGPVVDTKLPYENDSEEESVSSKQSLKPSTAASTPASTPPKTVATPEKRNAGSVKAASPTPAPKTPIAKAASKK